MNHAQSTTLIELRERSKGIFMNFEYTAKVKELQKRLCAFMDEHIYPNEQRFYKEIEQDRWTPSRVIEALKPKARAAGLWNLFLPNDDHGAGLTNLEYAPLCEIMGRSIMAPEVFNCSAPDTGNMEVLARYGTEAAGWRNTVVLRHDRACSRVVGRHQYSGKHPTRRQRVRDQWTQVVVFRRGRSPLQDRDLHGQD